MAAVANVTVLGWLSKDAVFDVTQNGLTRCRLSIPVNARRPDASGEQGYTAWYNVTVFGVLAENLRALKERNSLAKGTQIMISGRLEPRVWTNSDGVQNLSFDVTAESFQITGQHEDSVRKSDEKFAAAVAVAVEAAAGAKKAPKPAKSAVADVIAETGLA